jgi:hypothetical protein
VPRKIVGRMIRGYDKTSDMVSSKVDLAKILEKEKEEDRIYV